MAERRETQAAQDLSICQICKSGAIAPRLLPCLHAICGTCLEKLLRHPNENQHVCATCHIPLSVVHRVRDLPANNLAQFLLERNEKDLKSSAQKCTACVLDGKKKDKSAATVWCTICTEYFCDKCNRIHQQVINDKVHDVVRIAQLRKLASFRNGNTTFKKSKEMCGTHLQEPLVTYCDQCEEPICQQCEKELHKDHPYLPVSSAASDFRAEIKDSISSIEGKVTVVDEALEAWATYGAEVDKSEKETLELIDDYAKELISMVTSWHKQCLNTLQSATEKEREDIENKKDSYTNLQSSLKTAMMYGQRLLLQGQDAYVTCVKKNVVERIQELNSNAIEKPVKTFSFSFERTPDIENAKIFGTLSVDQNELNSDDLFIMKSENRQNSEKKVESRGVVSFKGSALTDRQDAWLTGVSCSSRGEIIVADHRNNVIKLFNDSGKFKRNIFVNQYLNGKGRFSGPSQSLWDCAWLSDGSVVTASVDGLHIFNINSELVAKLDIENEHTSVIVSPKNEIISYNDTKGHVSIHDASSKTFTRSFQVYEKHTIGWVSKVGVDHHGNILVCDVKNDSIKTFAPNGRLVHEIGTHGKGDGQFIRIRGVCCDASGNFLAADKGNHRLQKMALDGTMQKCLMTKTDGLESPSSVTMYGSTKAIVVTDTGFVHILPVV